MEDYKRTLLYILNYIDKRWIFIMNEKTELISCLDSCENFIREKKMKVVIKDEKKLINKLSLEVRRLTKGY